MFLLDDWPRHSLVEYKHEATCESPGVIVWCETHLSDKWTFKVNISDGDLRIHIYTNNLDDHMRVMLAWT